MSKYYTEEMLYIAGSLMQSVVVVKPLHHMIFSFQLGMLRIIKNLWKTYVESLYI